MSNWTEEESPEFFDPGAHANGEAPPETPAEPVEDETSASSSYGYDALFAAPDFSTLVKGRRKTGAREYETKVKSALKSGTLGALRMGDIPDAAALLKYGPAFAAGCGDVAAVNDRAKQMIDMLTAPENPYFALAFATIPLVGQLIRNHEEQLKAVPEVRKEARQRRKQAKQEAKTRNIEISLPFGRKIKFGVKWNLFKGMRVSRMPSRIPAELCAEVFGDPNLQDALRKQGIEIVPKTL